MATASVGLLLRQTFGKQFLGKKHYNPFEQLKTVAIRHNIFPSNYSYSTGVQQNSDVTVRLRDGLPVFSVPLPSRRENCEFTLKPITHTVGAFLKFLQEEDGGIDRSAIYTSDGKKIAKSTTVDVLIKNKFTLSINDQNYQVSPPDLALITHEVADSMANVKSLVTNLYSTLNIQEYQLEREKELVEKLEDLKVQLEPLEKRKKELMQKAENHTNRLKWGGCALMAVQFGVLARLTWWEYSWDIMEPVTYFVTYAASIGMYGYFLLSKHDYHYVEVTERQFLIKFYKKADEMKFDVKKYNDIKNKIALAELDLHRLRDPLQLNLPIQIIKEIRY